MYTMTDISLMEKLSALASQSPKRKNNNYFLDEYISPSIVGIIGVCNLLKKVIQADKLGRIDQPGWADAPNLANPRAPAFCAPASSPPSAPLHPARLPGRLRHR
jgi:hypothetical protein